MPKSNTKKRCGNGTRKCRYTKKCVKMVKSDKKRCPKGTRKCANNKCHAKKNSTPPKGVTRSMAVRKGGDWGSILNGW